MSGHSHAANIKHRKAATDAKKGREFSRWAKAIMVAVKNGGKEPESNLTLRYALDKARAANMPKDSIERAIKKGAGELPGSEIVEFALEGIAHGVSFLIECVTDNRNRTLPEIRKILEQKNGKIGNAGSVAWKFEKKGIISVPKGAIGEDDLMGVALDAGADDMQTLDDAYEVTCAPASFDAVRRAIEAKGVKPEVAEIMTVAKTPIDVVDAKTARRVLDLVEAVEDHDDVQSVAMDGEISEEVAAAARALSPE
jgi:YebC/PmpR family DNA-binding regulatory protein